MAVVMRLLLVLAVAVAALVYTATLASANEDRSAASFAGNPLIANGGHISAKARSLLHGGVDHSAEASPDAGSGRSYQWLKWVAGAVLLVEGLVGVLMPAVLRVTMHAAWLISLINCFAAAVFFSFGLLHLAPDAISAQESIGLDRFPLAVFLSALSFFVVFGLHRVLAPALRMKAHHAVVLSAAAAPGPQGCGCGDDCGCAGGVAAGKCGQACSAGACQCAQRKGPGLDNEKGIPGEGLAASSMAAVIPLAYSPSEKRPMTRKARALALIAPVIIMGGVMCHTVLEGLVIGLQRSYADVVTAFVAMASHKWVESIAVASVFMAAGSGFLAIVGFLVPFSLGPLVGIAIGVSVSNSNNWAVLVLFGLVSGLFIYVGTMGIIAEEFSKFDDPAHVASVPKGARFYLFAAMMAGFTVVALLQLVPEAG